MQALLDVIRRTLLLQHLLELLRKHLTALLLTEITQRATAQNHYEQYANGNRGRIDEGSTQLTLIEILTHDAGHTQRRKQRYGPLHHNQRHRQSTELIVARQIIEQKCRQPHQIITPRHHQRKECRTDNPPTLTVGQYEQSQQSQEDCRRTQIGRACRIGLCTTIAGQILSHLAQAVLVERLGHRTILRECIKRCAAHKIGNKERKGLGLAVTPRRSILKVEAIRATIRIILIDQLRATTNGLLGVLHSVPQG